MLSYSEKIGSFYGGHTLFSAKINLKMEIFPNKLFSEGRKEQRNKEKRKSQTLVLQFHCFPSTSEHTHIQNMNFIS